MFFRICVTLFVAASLFVFCVLCLLFVFRFLGFDSLCECYLCLRFCWLLWRSLFFLWDMVSKPFGLIDLGNMLCVYVVCFCLVCFCLFSRCCYLFIYVCLFCVSGCLLFSVVCGSLSFFS